MQVACVLKQGPEYTPEHVALLADSILKHNDVPIVCLSDIDFECAGVLVKTLAHNWPGWWSKLELFAQCNEPTLYLDLDTVVVGTLPEIGERFTMLRDVYLKGDFGSGVMSWQTPPKHVYDRFRKNPKPVMQLYRTRNKLGDQAFIRDNLGFTPEMFGPEFRSYKAHCKDGVPPGTRVVYFHGKPRPWQVDLCL